MTTLNAKLVAQIVATLSDPADLSPASAPLSYTKRIDLLNGTGLSQGDRMWHDQRTIAGSTTDSLDLAGGGLVDALGDAVTFARIKALLVSAGAANPNNINVTRPAANGVPLFLAASDAMPVPAGGVLMWVAPTAAGIVVTAGTGDLIDMVNPAAGAVTYDVVIIGASS